MADDILGFRKEVFMGLLQWGAIAGAVAGAIDFVGGLLTSLFSWGGLFGLAWAGFAPFELISDLFWGALWGVVTVVLVAKFYDQFPFQTFFMKIFGLMIIIDIVLTLLVGGFIAFFTGPLAFLVLLVTVVIADFVFAKIAASKAAPLVGLK